MTARKKKSKDCPFYFYSWCEWAKVKCHYTDEKLPPRPEETGPCVWAIRFCEKNFCPTPRDANVLYEAGSRTIGVFPKSTVRMMKDRICPECEKPVRPLKNLESYKTYQVTGECQECQDKLGDDLDELTEDDFQ